MRVLLNEAEILMAIEDFVLQTVNVPDDIRVDIDLKATRGDLGYTAEIDLVHMNSPSDGSDRSVDDRIQPTEAAREEGLGIVAKIEAAKATAKAPRRRGRPPGTKGSAALAQGIQALTEHIDTPLDVPVEVQAQLEETGADLNLEDQENLSIDLDEGLSATNEGVHSEEEDENQLQEDTTDLSQVDEANLSATHQKLIEQPQPLELPAEDKNETVEDETELTEEQQLAQEALLTEPAEEKVQPEPEPVVEEKPKTTKSSLFGNKAGTKKAEVPAEAQAQPAPEPEPVAETETPAAAPTEKPRSLFANLTKPVNKKPVENND